MSARRLIIAFLVPGALLLMCGCVSNRSYRRRDLYTKQLPAMVDPVSPPDADCSKLSAYDCVYTPKGIEPQSFYLAHIEFDDMGEMWSIGDLRGTRDNFQARPTNSPIHPSQLDNALAVVRKAQAQANCELGNSPTGCEKRELIVITFVHGWHNNASPYDEEHQNLRSFKTLMQGLSSRKALDIAKPPVLVGIFLSWRGQAVAGDLALTYWNRRDAATRVGGPSMTEVVTRLMFETKGVPLAPSPEDRCNTPVVKGKALSHFAIIAHSFGARALEHALTQPMLSLILERQAQAQECADDWNSTHARDQITDVSFPVPADLIVFLNAANDAFEAKETIEAFKRVQVKVSRKQPFSARIERNGPQAPIMISITSDGDWATEKIMPIAQFVSSSALSFRHYDDKNTCDQEGQLCKYGQSYYYRHSEASIKEMRSHEVILETSDASCRNDKPDNWPYIWVESTQQCFCIDRNTDRQQDKCREDTVVDQKKHFGADGAWNDTPFYVIGVPKSLIHDHNDIFRDGTSEMLIAISTHYETFFNAEHGPTMLSFPVNRKQ